MIVSLETLEHIVEKDVVRIIEALSSVTAKHFVFSVPVEIGPAVWFKNIGSFLTGYMRHKDYTWRETFFAGLYKLDKLEPHGVQHKGFDWRWLAQTIRHNLRIVELCKFPISWMPAAFSSSVFFVAKKR